MKILVLSDSHGSFTYMRNVLSKYENEIKYVIHLGDYAKDVSEIVPFFQNYEFINISGNCDFGSALPSEKTFSLYGINFFITHGHRYNVKSNIIRLAYLAEEKNAKVCLFGHTHIPLLMCNNNILYMNPGSISQPRGGTSYTYGIIDILESGNITARIFEITKTGNNVIMNF